MENEELVSIIIPCYNSEKYIVETLNSVIEQTYKNWECIIIDDHSIDNTWSILEGYQQNYPSKIFLYKNFKKGACAARNMGIENSNGVYLKFLDSDDALYNENVLAEQTGRLRAVNNEIVYGNEFFYSDFFSEEKIIKKRGGIISHHNPSTFFKNFPITSNFMLNKTLLNNFRWNEELKSGQEFFLLFQLFLNRINLNYHNINVCRIRTHNSPDRISNKSNFNYATQNFILYSSIIEEIKKTKELDKKLLFEIKKQLLSHSFNALRFNNIKACLDIQGLMYSKDLKSIKGNLAFELIFNINKLNKRLAFYCYRVCNRLGVTV